MEDITKYKIKMYEDLRATGLELERYLDSFMREGPQLCCANDKEDTFDCYVCDQCGGRLVPLEFPKGGRPLDLRVLFRPR